MTVSVRVSAALLHIHQCLSRLQVCVLGVYVCEAVGEVRGCEGEGYPTVSKRKRKK